MIRLSPAFSDRPKLILTWSSPAITVVYALLILAAISPKPDSCEKALALSPNETAPISQIMAVPCYSQPGKYCDYNKVILHCRAAIETNPGLAKAYWLLGLTYLTQGNLEVCPNATRPGPGRDPAYADAFSRNP